MTPAEFLSTYLAWCELETQKERRAWERERWSVWIATSIQLDHKDRRPMTEMFPLPWDNPTVQVPPKAEPTMQERTDRVHEILNQLKQ